MGVSWLLLKKSDRQSHGRLALTAAAIALGVLLVLSYGAGLNGFIQKQSRMTWQASMANPNESIDGVAPTYMSTLATDNLNLWGDETIGVVSLRATDETSPELPGLTTPQAGEYYASERLAQLIEATPDLAARFDGRLAGHIPDALLMSPDDLLVVRGMTVDEQTTLRVEPIYQFASADEYEQEIDTAQAMLFAIGSITLLFPIVLLISVATQLGSKQRERRYAALRLVGATRRQIDRIINLETTLTTVVGIAVGSVLFWLIRPLLAEFKLYGTSFFLEDVVVSGYHYVIVIIITLGLTLLANWWGMRKVKSSPLGVVRQQRLQKKPGWWRMLPLAAGIGLLIYMGTLDAGSVVSNEEADQYLYMTMAALLLLLFGMVLAGPWLTGKLAHVIARLTKKPTILLATKRIALLSRQTFRAVGGIVVALYIGSFYLAFVGGVDNLKADAINENSLSQLRPSTILVVGDGQLPADLDETLSRIDGVQALEPIYMVDSGKLAIACQSLPHYIKHSCPVGQDDGYAQLDLAAGAVSEITAGNIIVAADIPAEPAGYLLDGASALEAVRTAAATAGGGLVTSDIYVVSGEHNQKPIINSMIYELAQLAYVVIGLTLFVAVVSLIISTIGGMLERQRSFYTLRLSGMTVAQLRRIMLVESTIPLLAVSLIASALGVWTSAIFLRIAATTVTATLPPLYYAIVAVALIAAIASIFVISRQINALTTTEQNQTE